MILTLYITPDGNEAYYCPVCEEGAEGERTDISGFGACDGCGRERFVCVPATMTPDEEK